MGSNKTRVLCTGPESSGTRMLTRMVGTLDVTAIHRSIPHGPDWWTDVEYDAAVFIVRDPWITKISANAAGHPNNGFWKDSEKDFPWRIQKAHEVFFKNVIPSGKPWLPITYEGIVERPQWTLDNVAAWLGVDSAPLQEQIKDPRGNIK